MAKPSDTLRKFRFAKPVRILDKTHETVRDVVRFDRHDGSRGRIEATPAAIADPREILKILRNHDAVLPDEEDLQPLLKALAVHRPAKRKTLLAKSGWGPSLRWLIENGRITMAKVEKGPPAPKEQITWPDKERRRSFEILVPVGERMSLAREVGLMRVSAPPFPF